MAIIDVIQKKLNVQPDGIPTVVRLSQNENGRELIFDVENCEIPAGSTVTISGTKPDGNVYSLVGSISDNTVTFNEDIQMTAVGGQWDAKVVIVNGGNTVATGRVRMIIDPDTVDPDAVPSDSQLEGLVAQAQEYAEYAKGAAYGAPYVASTVAQMTDHDHVYVYTGSETGYTAGNWYYWSGSAWTSGGVYNSVAVATDKTLAVSDMAADSKVVGDNLTSLKSEIQTYDVYNSIQFSANYGKVECYIPSGVSILVKTLDGNNFSGGSIFLEDSSGQTYTWSMPSNSNKRTLTTVADIYKVYIGGETTPSNVALERVFEYKKLAPVIQTVGDYYITLSSINRAIYNPANYKLNIQKGDIFIYYGGKKVDLTHAKLITDLGSRAVEDAAGNLTITLDGESLLLYNTETEKAEVRAYNNFKSDKHIIILGTDWTARFGGGLPVDPLGVLKTPYAYLTDGGIIKDYNASEGSINIGASQIVVYANGASKTFNHSAIITDLGASYAAEDASGNLTIKIGHTYALVYNLATEHLQRVQILQVDKTYQAILFTAYYGSGSVGLLADSDNNFKIRKNENVTPIRLLNSSPSYIDTGFETNLTKYEKAIANAGVHSEQFLFFSDPHCISDIAGNALGMLSTIEKYYNCCSADYVLCGGDWLGNNDSVDSAVYKLGYVKGLGKSMLGGDDFYNIIGNHDTNYQGATTLTESQLRNVWYSGDKCYYKIKRKNCIYYALDTGVDNDDTLTSYRYEQLEWLCSQLIADNNAHNEIFMHIVFTSSADSTQISTMASAVGDIIDAFNDHTSITVNGNSYNFSACTGAIDFVLCGHVHADLDSTLGGVPCVAEIHTFAAGNGTASFDLCVADFDNRKLKMIRVGHGSDREFNI